jgi:hypothetical protein
MRCVRPSLYQLNFHAALIGATLLTSSVACAGLNSTAPADVDLGGTWTLNRDASDDQRAALGERKLHIERREAPSESGSISGGGPPGAGRMSDADLESMHEQMMQRLASAERIDIEQRTDAMTLKTDARTVSCGTTETTQVSTPDGGVADRQCGWDGNAFVIELKSPDGVTQRDSYTLTGDGKQLIVTTKLESGGGDAPAMSMVTRRVYDRAETR